MHLRKLDDWLAWEGPNDEDIYLSQDEIRHLNSDFNYKHYTQFYEKLEEQNDEDGNIELLREERKVSPNKKEEQKMRYEGGLPISALQDCISEDNILH